MTANRYCACGLIMSIGLFGCSRGSPPEGETPYASLYPNHESSFNMTDLSTPTESIDLAVLLKLPRAELATDAEVLSFIDRQSLSGRGVGYVDVHLLASVRLTSGAELWTRDKRLRSLAKELGLAMAS